MLITNCCPSVVSEFPTRIHSYRYNKPHNLLFYSNHSFIGVIHTIYTYNIHPIHRDDMT